MSVRLSARLCLVHFHSFLIVATHLLSPSLPFPSLPIIPALMTVQNEPDFRRRRSAPLEVRMVFSLGERDKSGWTRSRPADGRADGHGQSWLFESRFGGGRKEQRCNMISPGDYSRVTAQNARQVVVRPTLLPLSPILANGSRWSRRRLRALASHSVKDDFSAGISSQLQISSLSLSLCPALSSSPARPSLVSISSLLLRSSTAAGEFVGFF